MHRFLLVALLATAAHAQAPLVTDRPDLTESPLVVPLGRVQLETGATLVRSADATTLGGPEALIRWAPVRRAELRLALPDVRLTADSASFDAVGVGGKVEVGVFVGADVGVIGMLHVPLDGARVVPEAVLTMGRDVAFGSLGAQVSAAWSDGATLGATLVAGRGLSARVGSFIELAVEGQSGTDPAVLLHHGYTLAVGADAQVDLHAGVGLTGDAPAVFVGAGWSVRW